MKPFQRDDWKDLEIHPVANLLPKMDDEELDGLAASILEVGQKEPITLFGGRIADGRHRFQACLRNDIKPWFQEFIGNEEELKAHVFALNLLRRNLSSEQKKEIAVQLRKDGETMEAIALKMGVSTSSVHGWLKDKFKNENTETRTDAAGRKRPTSYNKKEKDEPKESPEEIAERRKEEAKEALENWADDYSDVDEAALAVMVKKLLSTICGEKKPKK